jgi:hypothetical protein
LYFSKKTSQRKQSPNRPKFAQSSHPVTQMCGKSHPTLLEISEFHLGTASDVFVVVVDVSERQTLLI